MADHKKRTFVLVKLLAFFPHFLYTRFIGKKRRLKDKWLVRVQAAERQHKERRRLPGQRPEKQQRKMDMPSLQSRRSFCDQKYL